MIEAQAIVMVEAKTSMFKDDDMPKSITSKKLNGLNYLAWAHACYENIFARQTNVEIFDR